jgi:Uma2 family endonuclease
MNEVINLEDEQPDEEKEMGSFNHSLTQGNLISLLHDDERFTTLVELSLDASQIELSQFGLKVKEELKPDVCVYTDPPEVEPPDDLIKTTQMPDLAIEILSPSQTVSELIGKLKAYFALSVKSCWLVIPATESITVFSHPNRYKTFGTDATEIIDEVMDIHLPIQKVFRRRPR